MKSLNDIKAVITGGASGLGLAVTEKIIADGGQVAIFDIDARKQTQIKDQFGSHALFFNLDVTQEAAVDKAVSTAAEKMGHINVNINCAGIAPSKRVLAKDGLMATNDFASVLTINLIGTFCVCRAVVNVMQHNATNEQDERGVIINTASIAAYDGQIGQAAYAASKGGITSMTLPLAREFARIGVRVVTIAPGLFKTPLFDNLPEKAVTALTQNTPFPKRLGEPSDFATLACHIVQNSMLNGEVIRLDGALRM